MKKQQWNYCCILFCKRYTTIHLVSESQMLQGMNRIL